jgi:hypothetical protein
MAFLTIILEWLSAALSTYKCVMVLQDTNVKRIEARVSPKTSEKDGKGTGEREAGGMGLPEERRGKSTYRELLKEGLLYIGYVAGLVSI